MSPNLSLLIVDDDDRVLDSLESVLHRIAAGDAWSLTIRLARSVSDALVAIHASPVDAIFLDYHLSGGINGDELLSYLTGPTHQPVIIMMSARPEEELESIVIRRHRSLGLQFRFLTKPISPLNLRSSLYTIADLVYGPAASEPIFSWMHLSDLHFGHGDAAHGWDQVLVTRALLADIAAQTRSIPKPDSVLVTGDIAFSGDILTRSGRSPAREYSDAAEFLLAAGDALGLSAESIFIVPGNHDVSWSADVDNDVRRLVEMIRRGDESLDEALASEHDRNLLMRRQANYLTFASRFAPACLSADTSPAQSLWWSHRLETRTALSIRLLGFNTAIVSAAGGDHGRLQLGKECLAKVLTEPITPEEIVVALSHHPFHGGWLADEQAAEAWTRNYVRVHLSGHLHEADSEEALSGSGGHIVKVTAGATHDEADSAAGPGGHGYNFASIVRGADGTPRLRVWPRRWSKKNHAFRADHENLPDGALFAEHHIRPIPGQSLFQGQKEPRSGSSPH